jgi:hypothetical protein
LESTIDEGFATAAHRILRDSRPVEEKVVKFGDVSEDYSFRIYLMPRRLDPTDAQSKMRRPYAQHPEFADVEFFPYVLAKFNGFRQVVPVDFNGAFDIHVGKDLDDWEDREPEKRLDVRRYKFQVSKQVYELANKLTINDDFIKIFQSFDSSGYELYKELVHVIMNYVDVPRWCASQTALWIMATYVYQGFNAFPYLILLAERGSGKTRMLRLITMLSSNGLFWVSASMSSLFRAVEALKPTLGLDEIEYMNDERNPNAQELLNLLNSGYERGAVVPRVNKDSKMMVEYFDSYCPKAIATTQDISGVLNSRCLRIPISRTMNKEFVTRDPMADRILLEDLQRELTFWAIENGAEIAAMDKRAIEGKYRAMEVFADVPPRIFQILLPVLSMFEFLKLGELSSTDKGSLFADEIGDLARSLDYQAQEARAISVDDDVQRIMAAFHSYVKHVGVPVTPDNVIDQLGLELDEKKFYSAKKIGRVARKFDIPKRKINGKPEYFGGPRWSQESSLHFLDDVLKRYSIDVEGD